MSSCVSFFWNEDAKDLFNLLVLLSFSELFVGSRDDTSLTSRKENGIHDVEGCSCIGKIILLGLRFIVIFSGYIVSLHPHGQARGIYTCTRVPCTLLLLAFNSGIYSSGGKLNVLL